MASDVVELVAGDTARPVAVTVAEGEPRAVIGGRASAVFPLVVAEVAEGEGKANQQGEEHRSAEEVVFVIVAQRETEDAQPAVVLARHGAGGVRRVY